MPVSGASKALSFQEAGEEEEAASISPVAVAKWSFDAEAPSAAHHRYHRHSAQRRAEASRCAA